MRVSVRVRVRVRIRVRVRVRVRIRLRVVGFGLGSGLRLGSGSGPGKPLAVLSHGKYSRKYVRTADVLLSRLASELVTWSEPWVARFEVARGK